MYQVVQISSVQLSNNAYTMLQYPDFKFRILSCLVIKASGSGESPICDASISGRLGIGVQLYM